MNKKGTEEWVQQPSINKVLLEYSVPNTPRAVEKTLGIKKLRLKPFLERNMLKSLNPEARKGRFYILTNKARKLLKLSYSKTKKNNNDWDLIGWIKASPRQRLAVLKTIAVDSAKRTARDIKGRAKDFNINPNLTRISTEGILKQLEQKGLVESELKPQFRKFFRGRPLYGKKLVRKYWVSERGKELANNLFSISDTI